jgi:hypothetical protein
MAAIADSVRICRKRLIGLKGKSSRAVGCWMIRASTSPSRPAGGNRGWIISAFKPKAVTN